MHPVRRMLERVPGIHGRQRPPIRAHLQRSDRARAHAVSSRPRRGRPAQHPVHAGLVPGTPRVARVPYRDRAPINGRGEGEPLTIFASCMVDRMLPQSAVALQRIAEAAGYNVGFPKAQWCCGLISANAGDFHSADELNTKLSESLRDSKGLIVTPSASCFGAFTIDAPDWGAQIDDGLRARFRDSTRFALQLLADQPDLVRTDQMSLKVAYHDSCQTLRQLGLKSEPRQLLDMAGYEVVNIPDIANCCGFGGTFSLEWPRVAARLADWKLDAIAKTGCTVVASDNPGCLMHIATAARKRGMNLRVAHVMELVAEHLA
ncbi:MAG: (Fe-S)-binding protein [Chloroflexi bacterium]|nr:MAG: (Fe-S)-binding protein [Chloroflexota bacterium]